MRIIGSFVLVCAFALGIFAQNASRIEGRLVQPAGSNAQIGNRTVTLISKADGREAGKTTTDAGGNFVFADVASGQYDVAVDCAECWRNPLRKTVTIGRGETLQTDVELARYGISESVTVAADSEQSVEQVSKSVDVITGQEMRDRADFSLAESLKTIPGFRVQQLGGFGRVATIKTRGLRNQDTALLIDGIRFRDASAITGDASPFLSDFTLTSVSRVEVLRGSGSSLYGTNAIGGVVDFQTPRPQSGWHGQVSGAFGGLGLSRLRGNTSYGTADDRLGFNLGFSRTDYFEGIDSQDDAHNNNFQARLDFRPFDRTEVSLRGFMSDAYVRLNTSPDTIGPMPASNSTIVDAVPLSISELDRYASGTPMGSLVRGNANFIPDANDPDSVQKSKFFSGQADVTHIFNDKLYFRAYYQALSTTRKNQNGPNGVGFQPFGGTETSKFEGQIYTGNAHVNWRPNRTNEITIGYENEWEKYGNNGEGPGGAGAYTLTERQTSHTIYAQDLLRFMEGRLQIAGGFRAQFFDLKTPVLSGANPPYQNLTLDNPPSSYTFDGAATYLFKTGTKIRAHVGNGYRVPSLYERFGAFYDTFGVPNSFIAIGDPNLKPERSIAFDGGVEQTLAEGRARLSATYFYTKLIDTIGYGNVVPPIGTTPRPFGGYLNTKGGISRGMEFSGKFLPTRSTDIFTSYTYTNSDQLVPQVTGSGITRTLGVPTNQFTVVATQRFDRFWVNFDMLATSSYLAPLFSNTTFSTYVFRYKGARKADLTGGYTLPLGGDKYSLRVFATAENVFGYDYYENGFRTAGRTGRAGLSFGW